MPIEIKEMHIKINVNGEDKAPEGNTKSGGGNSDSIIQECMDQVSKMIKNTKER